MTTRSPHSACAASGFRVVALAICLIAGCELGPSSYSLHNRAIAFGGGNQHSSLAQREFASRDSMTDVLVRVKQGSRSDSMVYSEYIVRNDGSFLHAWANGISRTSYVERQLSAKEFRAVRKSVGSLKHQACRSDSMTPESGFYTIASFWSGRALRNCVSGQAAPRNVQAIIDICRQVAYPSSA